MTLTCVCDGSAAGHVHHNLQIHRQLTAIDSLPTMVSCGGMVQNIYELIVSLITLLIKHSSAGSHDLTFHP